MEGAVAAVPVPLCCCWRALDMVLDGGRVEGGTLWGGGEARSTDREVRSVASSVPLKRGSWGRAAEAKACPHGPLHAARVTWRREEGREGVGVDELA